MTESNSGPPQLKVNEKTIGANCQTKRKGGNKKGECGKLLSQMGNEIDLLRGNHPDQLKKNQNLIKYVNIENVSDDKTVINQKQTKSEGNESGEEGEGESESETDDSQSESGDEDELRISLIQHLFDPKDNDLETLVNFNHEEFKKLTVQIDNIRYIYLKTDETRKIYDLIVRRNIEDLAKRFVENTNDHSTFTFIPDDKFDDLISFLIKAKEKKIHDEENTTKNKNDDENNGGVNLEKVVIV